MKNEWNEFLKKMENRHQHELPYEKANNAIEGVLWLANEGGWEISEEITFTIINENTPDVYIEIREAKTNELLHCVSNSTNELLDWLENNKEYVKY